MTPPSAKVMLRSTGGYAALQANLPGLLDGFSLREWRRRLRRLERAVAEFGVLSHAEEKSSYLRSGHRFDPIPFQIAAGEWRKLSEGVTQRVRMLNAFLGDFHNQLRNPTSIPFPVGCLFPDSSFLLEYAGLESQGPSAALCAIDVVKTDDGRWLVADHCLSVPTGLSRVLQGRRLQAQFFPEWFGSRRVEPVATFPGYIAEELRLHDECGNGVDSGAVLLASIRSMDDFMEEGFLARQTGLPVVTARDLLVRDFQVYYKTVRGLIRVHTIFRRMQSGGLDPVTGLESELHGVPGLFHCLRFGTVRMVNTPGSGLADNRILLRYSRALIRNYLNEQAILDSLPTLSGHDPDQLDEFASRPSSFWVRSAVKNPHSPPQERAELHGCVAHPLQSLDKIVYWDGDQFSTACYSMRLFCLMGSEAKVLPGAWLRLAEGAPVDDCDMARWIGFKDVWVDVGERGQGDAPRLLESRLDIGEAPLGSVTAESMYWLGRYLERIDNTARMTGIMSEGYLSAEDGQINWDAFMAFVGEDTASRLESMRDEPEQFAASMLLRRDIPASVAACMEQTRSVADLTIGSLGPEFGHQLRNLFEVIRPYAQRKRLTAPERRSLCAAINDRIAGIAGVADRTMMHDEGWRFFKIGSLLERAIITVNMLARVLPVTISHQLNHQLDDSELTCLLRMTGTLDAYHRTYRSRAFIDRIAHLLWQHPRVPQAVGYCLRESLDHVVALGEFPASESVREQITSLIDQIEALPITDIFPARSLQLDWGLWTEEHTVAPASRMARETSETLRGGIEAIHEAIEAAFMSHEVDSRLGKLENR